MQVKTALAATGADRRTNDDCSQRLETKSRNTCGPVLRLSLTSHVGAGSSWHVLFGAEPINFATSSTVTAAKSASDDVSRRGTSHSGVAAVDARTESTVSLKYSAKSTAGDKE